MIIDFHTHTFPDEIAERTIHKLEAAAGIHARVNGTLAGLKTSMKQAGVDYSVILPVVTKPSQFDTINQCAAAMNGSDHIISFGGIHPNNTDIPDKLAYIRQLGLPGIKLHPDYQEVHINDERYLKLITAAVDLGLLVIIHAGIDVGLPEEVHCPPEEAVQMLCYVEEHAKDPGIRQNYPCAYRRMEAMGCRRRIVSWKTGLLRPGIYVRFYLRIPVAPNHSKSRCRPYSFRNRFSME